MGSLGKIARFCWVLARRRCEKNRRGAPWRKAVQIGEPFEGLTRLCRLMCGKPLAFRLNPPRSALRAGWRLSLPASAEEVGRGRPPRKGKAFPHIRRRSRESPTLGSSAIWTSLGLAPALQTVERYHCRDSSAPKKRAPQNDRGMSRRGINPETR